MRDRGALQEAFRNAGQEHVFCRWDHLDKDGKDLLCRQAQEIDLEELERLVKSLVLGEEHKTSDLSGLEPAPYIRHPARGGDAALWKKAAGAGAEALRAGRVAAFTVAGGQGTRLGFDGPKGAFPVTPVKNKPLFRHFAEKLRAASGRYGKTIPWFIMTSHANHEQTADFFHKHAFFELNPEEVYFFKQGRMPAVDFQGKILLDPPGVIAMNPDGHGGSLRALVRNGMTDIMRRAGIDVISYFQVDNPLVQCIDPAFIGFHLLHESEMSSKTIPKAYPLEKVGHFCRQHGRCVVVEYSDMPETMQEERGADGELRFRAGSIAIHILARVFIERMGGNDARFDLPFHRADKKIKTIDEEGRAVKPDRPNGVKFEMFVFDALPFAENPVIIETLREDDFSPVKNPAGIDSAASARDDLLRLWTRWLRAAGAGVSAGDAGLPPFPLEISPLFAPDQETFIEKWKRLKVKPPVTADFYLE